MGCRGSRLSHKDCLHPIARKSASVQLPSLQPIAAIALWLRLMPRGTAVRRFLHQSCSVGKLASSCRISPLHQLQYCKYCCFSALPPRIHQTIMKMPTIRNVFELLAKMTSDDRFCQLILLSLQYCPAQY